MDRHNAMPHGHEPEKDADTFFVTMVVCILYRKGQSIMPIG
jgi:hypothetical protein